MQIISLEVVKETDKPSPGNLLCEEGAFFLKVVFTADDDAEKSFLDNWYLSGKGIKVVPLYTDPELTNIYAVNTPLYTISDIDFFTKEDEQYVYQEWVSYNPITRAALDFIKDKVGKTIEVHPLLGLIKTFSTWWD